MKKVFLALMAVAAIALTGCDKSGEEPGKKTDKNVQAMVCYVKTNHVFLDYYDVTKIIYTMPGEQPQTETVQWTTEGDYKVLDFRKEVPSKGKASFQLVCERNEAVIDTTKGYDIYIIRAEGFGVGKNLEEAASAVMGKYDLKTTTTYAGKSHTENYLARRAEEMGDIYEYTFN